VTDIPIVENPQEPSDMAVVDAQLALMYPECGDSPRARAIVALMDGNIGPDEFLMLVEWHRISGQEG